MGDAFINNFVTEIDFGNSTLTFTQNAFYISAGATVTPAANVNKLSTAAVVGSIVGGLVLLAAIAAICFFSIRRAKQRKAAAQSLPAANVANNETAHTPLYEPNDSIKEKTEDNSELGVPIFADSGQ